MGSDCWTQRESLASDPGVRGFGTGPKEYFKWEKDGLFNKEYFKITAYLLK